MLLIYQVFLAFAQAQRLDLPADWNKASTELRKITGWRYDCPNFEGVVPGPGLAVEGQDPTPFRWADQLAIRLNRGVTIEERTRVITLAPLGPGGRWYAAHSGPFRLIAKGGVRETDFQDPGPNPERYLKVVLGWEPGVEPLLVPSVWDGVYLRSHSGQEQKWPGAGGLREPGGSQEYQVSLRGLTESLREGWSLRLTGKAIVPTALRVVELGEWPRVRESLAKGPVVVASDGPFSCSLVDSSQNGRRVSLRVRIERDPAGPELESYQSWVVLNQLWMTDRLGEEVRPVGQVLEKQDERVAEVTYHLVFPEGTERRPRVIHYRTLTGIREVRLDFDLKGLPALP